MFRGPSTELDGPGSGFAVPGRAACDWCPAMPPPRSPAASLPANDASRNRTPKLRRFPVIGLEIVREVLASQLPLVLSHPVFREQLILREQLLHVLVLPYQNYPKLHLLQLDSLIYQRH